MPGKCWRVENRNPVDRSDFATEISSDSAAASHCFPEPRHVAELRRLVELRRKIRRATEIFCAVETGTGSPVFPGLSWLRRRMSGAMIGVSMDNLPCRKKKLRIVKLRAYACGRREIRLVADRIRGNDIAWKSPRETLPYRPAKARRTRKSRMPKPFHAFALLQEIRSTTTNMAFAPRFPAHRAGCRLKGRGRSNYRGKNSCREVLRHYFRREKLSDTPFLPCRQ